MGYSLVITQILIINLRFEISVPMEKNMVKLRQKGFGSAVCEQRNREIVHIVSETADPIPFRGTPHRKKPGSNLAFT